MTVVPLTHFAVQDTDQAGWAPVHEVAGRLGTMGMALVSGLTTRAQVLAFAERLMDVVPHRDSDPDGLTTLRNVGPRAHQPGFAGLGAGELLPHTERSSIPQPPRLMLLVCQQPAAYGGAVLLSDGQSIHAHLAEHAPDALEAMLRPGTAFYGDGGGHASQIFTMSPDGRVTLRLRQDALAQFSPLVQPFLPDLRRAITAAQRRLLLKAGEGYVIDNHRFLHAREAFDGDRVCLRALGVPTLPMCDGFTTSASRRTR
ncbi:TauD/TfdA family dioxygenase [Streptomyces sp. NPDC059176]|uniref:TauD/TfdA family dioxygenase n=1 Tax=Streptomyces sp. NPDC059176 TaxID=3346758 RepID=UPI0036CF3995